MIKVYFQHSSIPMFKTSKANWYLNIIYLKFLLTLISLDVIACDILIDITIKQFKEHFEDLKAEINNYVWAKMFLIKNYIFWTKEPLSPF